MRGLAAGFALDSQFHWSTTGMEHTKELALRTLARVLTESGAPYALIGGLALQVHAREARTTLDVDIAVLSRDSIPTAALEAAGFRRLGDFPHSQNWESGDGVPVQFTDDPSLAAAVAAAEPVPRGDVTLRVIRVADLLREKLRAGSDPARRRSKRLQDLADAQALLEQDPRLGNSLSAEQRALLERLPL